MSARPRPRPRRPSQRIGRDWAAIIEAAAAWVTAFTERFGTAPDLRSVHYALLSIPAALRALYDNTRGAYNYLSERTSAMRDEGTFPQTADMLRDLPLLEVWASPGQALYAWADGYRRDRTEGQKLQLIVVVEKAGLRGVLRTWADPRGIAVVATRGNVSQAFLAQELRPLIDGDDRPTMILALFDWDPSGWHMLVDLEARLNADGVERDVRVVRVGLLWEQAEPLPTSLEVAEAMAAVADADPADWEQLLPEKITDNPLWRRWISEGLDGDPGRARQIELNAWPVDDMLAALQAALVDPAIGAWAEAAYQAAVAAERQEREQLQDLADEMGDDEAEDDDENRPSDHGRRLIAEYVARHADDEDDDDEDGEP